MTLLIHPDPQAGILRLEGTFTFDAHGEFKTATTELLESKGLQSIVLDLAGLDYMDSAALGMLLLLRERAEARNMRVVLQRPASSVKAILDVVQFGRIFEIREA
jgi:anti-anti-sigma factor